MQIVAEILMRRAHSPIANPNDQARGIKLASAALAKPRDWAGPTDEALDILLRSLMTAGQFREALDRALPEPDGDALPQEAIRPGVQAIGALAAAALGRSDLSAKIVESMAPGLDRDVAQLRTARPGVNGEALWIALLDRLDESHPEALLQRRPSRGRRTGTGSPECRKRSAWLIGSGSTSDERLTPRDVVLHIQPYDLAGSNRIEERSRLGARFDDRRPVRQVTLRHFFEAEVAIREAEATRATV
jgi:hypothetical protein